MFTQKASRYFALATVFLVLGLFLGDWQLASLTLPLASLFVLANIWGIPDKVALELDHEVTPSDSFGEEDIELSIEIKNKTGSPVGNIEITEQLPPGVSLEKGAGRVRTGLLPSEKISLPLDFPNPGRGNYQIGPLVAKVQDPFGLYLVEDVRAPETLSVMPRPERIRGAELRPRHLGPWPGTIPGRIPGSGTEFFSLRGYVTGDDPKRVNWKASARYRRLIVNETEAEKVTDVMVVLDTDVTFFGPLEAELFERGISAAASMADLLLKQGNRVGLILQGGERGFVSPAFGKRHERNILYLLAAAKPGRAMISTSYVVKLLAHVMLPAKAQIVLISPLLDSTIVSGLRDLAVAGYSILVVSPSMGEPAHFDSEAEQIAYRMIMLERSNTLLAVQRFCTAVSWPVGVPLSTVLRKVRRVRPLVPA
ncbi:MAG TPA: DUF58 domain-containing protein [Candidatus Bathyarchaeia archaeon]|nr:DUF58 domain-containing protein [Candidatus Bathyarchaeia archaeon]